MSAIEWTENEERLLGMMRALQKRIEVLETSPEKQNYFGGIHIDPKTGKAVPNTQEKP